MQLMMQLSRRATTHENTLYNPCIVKVSREVRERDEGCEIVCTDSVRDSVSRHAAGVLGRESRAVLIKNGKSSLYKNNRQPYGPASNEMCFGSQLDLSCGGTATWTWLELKFTD